MKKSVYFLFLVLVGCANTSPSSSPVAPVPAQRPVLSSKLQKEGVQCIRLGNEVKLILPSHRLFLSGTPHLKSTAYPILNNLVLFLNQQANKGIEIRAYTPWPGTRSPNTVLSRQQAQQITAYLIEQGLDTRLIVAKTEQDISKKDRSSIPDAFNNESNPLFSIEVRFHLQSIE